MRQLMHLVRGAERAEWGRFGTLAAIVANANRDPKKRRKPFAPADFMPEWLHED